MLTPIRVPKKREIVILGFGNQAKAWALNLRDSGWHVRIALREQSQSQNTVRQLHFELIELSSTERLPGELFFVGLPDHVHQDFFQQYADCFIPTASLVFAHGFSLTQGQHYPWNCLLLAPKAIASELRFQYESKGKLGAVYSLEALHSQASPSDWEPFVHKLASDLGITAGPFQVEIAQETRADLFSEQSLLCSLLPYAGLKAYNALRNSGYPKELAYFECWYELKLIVDSLVSRGPDTFFGLISPNALVGSEKGRKLLNEEVNLDAFFERILNEVENGKFYSELEEIDLEQLKQETLCFWRDQELTQTHRELEGKLYTL